MSDGKMVMTEQYSAKVNKKELAPGLFVYSDVIPSYDQLLPYLESVIDFGMDSWETSVLGGIDVDTITLDYPQVFKDPNDYEILFRERMSLVLGGFLAFVENDYLQSGQIKSNQVSLNKLHDKIMLMKYGVGAEFPLSGKDNGSHISVMYYLNDNYQGGSIDFPNLGVKYQPKANEALIFPAADGFEYSIEKITDGVKYSVLSYLR